MKKFILKLLIASFLSAMISSSFATSVKKDFSSLTSGVIKKNLSTQFRF